MDKVAGITPDQLTGSSSDTEHTVTLSSPEETDRLFELATSRLQNVNHWAEYCGDVSASFTIFDSEGQEVDRLVQKGDYFRINIPGPGSKTGEGYDWVRVEEIAQEKDLMAIMVRPAPDPHTPAQDTAHFFKSDATSTFAVKRDGNKVTASVQGRNEKPNHDTEHLIDKVRNVVVAVGAVLGFSNPQWKKLVKGLLDDK